MKNKVFMPLVVFLTVIPPGSGFAQESAVRWWEGYQGTDATGDQVLGFWKFDGDAATFADDSSSHDHPAVARGAVWHSAGRFGGCLESSAGYPVADQSHGLHVAKSPVLSPTGAFTVEMWIRPKSPDQFPATMQPVLLDMKYVPGDHTGFMLSLTRASGDGRRRLAVEIGCGNESHHWYSDPLTLSEDHWQHIAFTYDRQGTVAFFVDGSDAGRSTQPAAGPMAAAARPLSIGDRIGSLYRGFPGYIDEVRLTRGIREFRPVGFTPDLQRFVFVRMSDNAEITAELINQTGAPLSDVTLSVSLPDDIVRQVSIPDLAAAEHFPVRVNLNTSLKPGSYAVVLTVNLPDWAGMKSGYQSTTRIPFVITRRLPPRMPVVMWGIGGTDGVVREIPRLKQIGFTHCLGLRADYQKIWDEKAIALPAAAAAVREGREMLNVALEHDLQIVASLSPGRWLRTAAAGKPFLRVDRDGRHYQREDISGLFPAVQDFCFDTGAAMGRAYGDHPAFAAALLHTEVRGESQVSFHPLEIDAFRQATGAEIPPEVSSKNGVQYQRLKNFPDNRVVADDHPILQYLQWFWTEGDGWNQLNTRLHEGLQQQTRPGAFWTFHDPAARVPSIRGSGGQADVLAHWTYTYPDPVRVGLCTDELFEMARVNGHDQNVMKMTQLIWYRSQTAPKRAAAEADPSPWVDQDPDADYITIAPMHLREAFWWKIARPIKGIMYHGWQSLVESDSPGAYRYTNPNTRHELQRLIEDVVVPLGPTLLEIPDAVSDVVFLESFTSQMFSRRGTYGWNHSWAGDMYHVLMYAQLQPRVLYEQSLLNNGLAGAKVLVMADCDVLTESAVRTIQQFQAAGGLVIGDAEVCPAITPDLVIPRFSRSKQADQDRKQLQTAAAELRRWLDSRYERAVQSTNPDVVTRRRRFGTTDYVFAVNDRREFGSYVGGYGLVMEDGLPAETTLLVNRNAASVYDLRRGRELPSEAVDGQLRVPLQLGPCDGQLLMFTDRPIRQVQLQTPDAAVPGDQIRLQVAVTDGQQAIDAVVPLQVRIVDPEGTEAEFTGYYAAANGKAVIEFDFASNDRLGVWQIQATELASGKTATSYVRLRE